MSDDHPEVLVPHDRRDLRRVGAVIAACCVPLFVAAWRFVALGADAAERNGGWTFAFGGALLLSVGTAIFVKARRPG